MVISSDILFLGTGAADWTADTPGDEHRDFSSVLVDGSILIDCTAAAPRKMAALGIHAAAVSDVLLTHGHVDHFDPRAVEALAGLRLRATGQLLRVHADGALTAALDSRAMEVHPLTAGQAFGVGRYRITPLAANHPATYPGEQPLHYRFADGPLMWLYATDGAWMTYDAFALLRPHPLSGLVVDCTIGDGHEGDYRIFEHNSLPMVRLMTAALLQSGILAPEAPVVLTHLARTLHPGQARLDEALRFPFRAAYDGCRLTLSAPDEG